MSKRGQLSIIAGLLVAVILVATVVVTYSVIRSNPIKEQPPIQSAIDETNFAIKQILGFTVGYYGSILKVTGNSSYARMLATNYLQSGLVNVANMHPEWSASLEVNGSELYTYWFTNASYSKGSLVVKYNLTGLGISGITYATSCQLSVNITSAIDNQACLKITKDEDEPLVNLGKQNFKFFRYEDINSTWELISPSSEPIAYANGTYQIEAPIGVDLNSYVIQVEDPRGIFTVASSFSRYTYTLDWSPPLNSTIEDSTIIVELLQNGTLRWLGQNLDQTQTKPIPPIPIKLIHVNQTINGVSCEVPFQIEEWASDYQTPLGLASNESVFNGRAMLVFLANPTVSNVTTVWWDGSDTMAQTPYAYINRYFTEDDLVDGILTNGNLSLILQSPNYLYVDGYDGTSQFWTESGAPPYLNDNTASSIRHNRNNEREGWFYFRDLTAAQITVFSVVKSVKVDFDCSRSGNDDYFDFLISDGVTTYGPYSITPPGSYDWKSYDVSSVINTITKINNAKIEVRYRQVGGAASTVSIRRCRLVIDFGGWLTSVMRTSTAKADFMRINNKTPTYGSNLAYIIHHGIIRDVIHQEAEWSNGITDCPNVYSQMVVTLPANATYYTYQLRLMFVESQQNRNISDLCPIKITTSGQVQTENGTADGYPVISNATDFFYNYSSTSWAHHWSQFISGTRGAGIMFTDSANQKLYVFDSIAGNKTGGLKANFTAGIIELLPVAMAPANFTYAFDVTWHGAVATFDGTVPIYDNNDKTGLWMIVEYPPKATATTES